MVSACLQSRQFPANVFPGTLLPDLASAAAGSWSGGSSSRGAERGLAVRMLAEVLPCVGEGVRDERQVRASSGVV